MISPAMRSLRLRTAVNTSQLPSWSRAATGVDDRNFFEVVGEIIQDGKADVVLGKALRVLPVAELLKPVSDLLHRGQRPEYRASSARAETLFGEAAMW